MRVEHPVKYEDGTIVLAVGAGWGVKSLLQTAALEVLRRQAQVTVLAAPALLEPLAGRLPADVGVEPLAPFSPQEGRFGALYRRRNLAFLQRATTATRRHTEARTRAAAAAGSWRPGLGARVARWIGRFEARVQPVNRLLRREAEAFAAEYPQRRSYQRLFDRLRPRLVVSTVPHIPAELPPVLIGQQRGIPAAACICSWDNLTSKPAYWAAYDRYLVWSERMCDELASYYPECRPDCRQAIGVAHFDWYRDPAMAWSRARFCAHWGFDPARPLVFYGAATPHLAPAEHRIIVRLVEDLAARPAAERPQLLVRLHPGDAGGRLRCFEPPPDVRLDVPGATGAGRLEGFCPSVEQNRLLVNAVRHADVVVNLASTLTLEAAVCDRPVIGVAYDLAPGQPFRDQIDAYYHAFDHFKTVVACGALELATSPGALLAAIDGALADPTRQRQGRARAVALWCGAVDGHAGERLGQALAAMIAPPSTPKPVKGQRA